ncbi:MAG: septation protein A [Brachymonas sp.]|nr:septation protein A [Brachymonas sp.]
MKQILEFIPLVLFVLAYKLKGIYFATGVLMAATVLQMAALYAIDKKLSPMHKVTLVLILVFGALTLLLRDERFIKWKPTVLYTVMALALAVALWGFKKNVLRIMLGSQLNLPEPVWHKLAIAWMAYCLFMAAINAFMVVYFTTDQWMSFKLWGYVFPLIFIVGQGMYIMKYLKDDDLKT